MRGCPVSSAKSEPKSMGQWMTKAKSKAAIHVADGSGDLVKVDDHRFESEPWPINFEVPKDGAQADDWLRYLKAECFRRGWNSSGVSQIERRENSGSLTISPGVGKAQLAIRWERRRDDSIKVSARPVGEPGFPIPDAEALLETVNANCRSRATERVYRRGTLYYQGLAWRGELWLDDHHRLAPPSRQDETAILGPRVVHLDVMLDCIGLSDAPRALQDRLYEVCAFLSVVMRKAIWNTSGKPAWTWEMGTDAVLNCAVRQLGYLEANNPLQMPQRGEFQAVPLRPVHALPQGIDGSTNEQLLRDDVVELWASFRALPTERRRQFLQAAAKWQEAMALWSDRDTLSFALMVVACEALKPPDADRRANVYDVIGALLGKDTSNRIRGGEFAAQTVRNAHLHAGELLGDELIRSAFNSSYRDPSFMEAHRQLATVTPAAMIEWLVRGGAITVSARKRSGGLRRRIVDNLWIAFAFVLGAGAIAGWVMRSVI